MKDGHWSRKQLSLQNDNLHCLVERSIISFILLLLETEFKLYSSIACYLNDIRSYVNNRIMCPTASRHTCSSTRKHLSACKANQEYNFFKLYEQAIKDHTKRKNIAFFIFLNHILKICTIFDNFIKPDDGSWPKTKICNVLTLAS